MELVALLRILWRHRIGVVVGGVVAIGLGLVAVQGSTSSVGVGSMRVLLDTPKSQTLDAHSPDVWWLTWQAALLGDLAGADATQQRVAREMNIPPDSLAITAPAMSVPPVGVPLPEHALDAAAALEQPYQLSIQSAPSLPIIGIDATAPDRAQAARLLTAAANALKAEAESEAPVDVAPGTRVVVEPVGPVQEAEVVNGPRRVIAVIVAAIVFGAWCTCITLFAAVSRARGRWSQAQPAAIG